MTTAWKRLIRFVAHDDKIYRGEPLVSDAEYDVGKLALQGKTIKAKVIEGETFSEMRLLLKKSWKLRNC